MSHKIIGRFEPIGAEIGPKRVGFNVLTIGEYVRDGTAVGFKGERLDENQQGVKVISPYSVISEHWAFVPAEREE